jgi:hypothetical protein
LKAKIDSELVRILDKQRASAGKIGLEPSLYQSGGKRHGCGNSQVLDRPASTRSFADPDPYALAIARAAPISAPCGAVISRVAIAAM